MPKIASNDYTLRQLAQSLIEPCQEAGMCAPSLVTLKNWSAQGFFKNSHKLNQAIARAIGRMEQNKALYPIGAARKSHPGSLHAGQSSGDRGQHHQWLAQQMEAAGRRLDLEARRVKREQAEDDDRIDSDFQDDSNDFEQPEESVFEAQPLGARHFQERDTPSSPRALEAIETLGSRMDDLEEQMRLMRHMIGKALAELTHAAQASTAASDTPAKAGPTQSVPPQLVTAIEQLDALRRHMLLRLDAETQLMKNASANAENADQVDSNRANPGIGGSGAAGWTQPSSRATQSHPQRTVSASSDADTYIAIQKIMAKLSRMEQMMANAH